MGFISIYLHYCDLHPALIVFPVTFIKDHTAYNGQIHTHDAARHNGYTSLTRKNSQKALIWTVVQYRYVTQEA